MTDIYERAKVDDEAWEREHDSREKLERDIRFGSVMTMYSNSDETEVTAKWSDVLGWLDRQAAITERHWMEISGANTLANIELNKQREELQSKVDELNAEADALREVNGHLNGCVSELRAKVDELQAELDAYDQTHMLLPVDADGVPIHCGERMRLENGHEGDVWLIGVFDIMMSDHTCFDWAKSRHVKQRTVEDVLEEFAARVLNSGHQWGLDAPDVVPEFADELRWLGVCDE